MRKVTKREEEYSMEDKVAVKMPGLGWVWGRKEGVENPEGWEIFSRGLPAPGI